MMRRVLTVAVMVVALPATAAADTFGGFGGREDGYLVGRDRICTPLVVEKAVATGTPSCKKASADEVAHLSVKESKPVKGLDATHTASAKSRTLTVTKSDGEKVLVTWEAPDPIARVENVYVSRYANLVGVEYVVRRGGRDVTEVVVFDVRSATTSTTTTPTTTPDVTPAPEETPEVKKAVKAARKKKNLKAWQKVLALDPEHSEAMYGVALAHAKAKKKEDTLVALEALAKSGRDDAVEFLVAARFDKAFASIRAEPRFRSAVGLDGGTGGFYVRLMGHGGKWEQTETPCDAPGMHLTFDRGRTWKLVVTTNCGGDRYSETFKGRWEPKEPNVTMVMTRKGSPDQSFECRMKREGDEDALECVIDADLQFVARPVRR